jgi:hypothetical protein
MSARVRRIVAPPTLSSLDPIPVRRSGSCRNRLARQETLRSCSLPWVAEACLQTGFRSAPLGAAGVRRDAGNFRARLNCRAAAQRNILKTHFLRRSKDGRSGGKPVGRLIVPWWCYLVRQQSRAVAVGWCRGCAGLCCARGRAERRSDCAVAIALPDRITGRDEKRHHDCAAVDLQVRARNGGEGQRDE